MDRREYLQNIAIAAQNFGFVPIGILGAQRIENEPVGFADISTAYLQGRIDNVGVLTGAPSNIVVFHVHPDALDWWNELITANNAIVDTFMVQTGDGGLDVYYRYDPSLQNISNFSQLLGENVEYRSNGEMAVFPGSVDSVTGQQYLVQSGYVNNQPIIADLPSPLLGVLSIETETIREETADIATTIACEQLDQIKQQEIIGIGSEGTVYRHCVPLAGANGQQNICQYVVKIQDCDGPQDYSDLLFEQEITNRFHEEGLAPRIYRMLQCGDECLILMDFIEGKTLRKLIGEGGFTLELAKQLVQRIDQMHELFPHGHGDLNPQNIIYNNNQFTFIDLSPEKLTRQSYEDYMTFLYYLTFYCRHMSWNICSYFFSVIRDRILPYINNISNPRFYREVRDIIDLFDQMDKAIASRGNSYSVARRYIDRMTPIARDFFHAH